MADYQFSKLAEGDLAGITTYTALNFGHSQSFTYTDNLLDGAQTAADFPSFGLPYTTKKGKVFQKYSVGRHAIFYQPTETGILIVRILHLMMDFDRHLDR